MNINLSFILQHIVTILAMTGNLLCKQSSLLEKCTKFNWTKSGHKFNWNPLSKPVFDATVPRCTNRV